MLDFFRRQSLFWVLGIALVAVQAIAMVALAWFTIDRVKAFAHDKTLDNLAWVVPLLESPYEELLNRHALPEEIDRFTKRIGTQTGVRVTFIAPDGIVLGDSHHNVQEMDNHGTRPEILDAVSDGEGTSTRFSNTLGFETIYFASHLVRNGEPSGVIRVSVPVASVDEQLTGFVRLLIVMLVVAQAVSLLVVALVARRMSRTVTRMGAVAVEYASGTAPTRAIVPPGREFRALADALNQMSGKLNDQIDQLETQRNELDAILRSMESGVIALDLNSRVLRLNKAARRMLGLWGDEARGRLLAEVVDQPALIEFVEHAMAQEGKAMDQFELFGAQPIVVRVVKRSLADADERITGMVLILNDITRLKRLEGIRSDFAANVSHELRTPITNIKGYVETLRDTSPDDQEQFQKFLDVIARNTSRLGAIVEDMLALTRIEQSDNEEAIEHEPRQLAELVRTVFSHLEPEASDRSITLTLEGEPGVSAMVNSPLMEQAVMNLVSNSIKYTHPRSTITVTVRRVPATETEKPRITIAVSDNGPGIAHEHLPRLFERFYRVDKARSRSVGGTGLGLAIVKHIAIVHGGRVDVQSDVGVGTTFTISLPVREEPAPKAP